MRESERASERASDQILKSTSCNRDCRNRTALEIENTMIRDLLVYIWMCVQELGFPAKGRRFKCWNFEIVRERRWGECQQKFIRRRDNSKRLSFSLNREIYLLGGNKREFLRSSSSWAHLHLVLPFFSFCSWQNITLPGVIKSIYFKP